jgi:hypothetical protein
LLSPPWPSGRHDETALAHARVRERFEEFVRQEQDLRSYLQRMIEQDEMLDLLKR